MRNRNLASLALALATVAGCEDGPRQVYAPTAPGSRDFWNNANTPGYTDNSKAPFVVDVGGTNKQELCNGPEKAMRWAAMVKKPITPPRFAAGLDLAGGDDWHGLTIEEAEKVNCQSDNQGDRFGDGDQVNSWGDNGEVWVNYRVSTRKVVFMTLWPGYLGTVKFHSLDGNDTYEIGIQTQILKNNKPFILDWTGNKGANFPAQADELYRALLATYAPGLPTAPDGVTCTATGRCIKGSFGDVAYFYIPAIGWAFWVDNQNAAQPTPSIATRLDQDLAKLMPYAFAQPLMKLDAEGPVGYAGKLGKATTDCQLKMGLTFGQFLSTCVQVSGDANIDKTELNKLEGGLSHGAERFHFDVQGVDINFTDNTLPPTDIIHDTDRPTADDFSTSFVVDQSTLGSYRNDLDSTGKTDLHGAGAVYKEYARLVRQKLLAAMNITDGSDLSACLYPNPLPNNFNKAAFEASLPNYCTGFEGFLTAAPPTKTKDPNNLGLDVLKVAPELALGLKLGHQKAVICWDPTGDVTKGYKNCVAGDIFSTSYARILAVFGKGKTANLPPDIQDVRFFFKMYTTAFIKYLHFGDQNPVPDISGVVLNDDNFFFDSLGAGQFEIAEYVDRRFASKTQPPTDFTFVADVRNGIFASYAFSRDLFRGEEAIYAAVLEDPVNDGLGQENSGLLTNVFGSPVLKNGWKKAKSGKSAYYCATTLDPTPCDGQTPPLDAAGNVLLDTIGRPVLAPYPGAFTSTAFSLGSTQIKVKQIFNDIQSALVSVPLHMDPYNTSSSLLPRRDFLVPWLPKQPGVGFPVALSGTLDKFVQTAQLDFSGTTITANVDYEVGVDAKTGLPNGMINFLAVETKDFLGEVFVCQDPATRDILSVRMYSPVAKILNWLQDHPASYDSCGIIIRYSPFGNFADFITSLTNGVRLGITQGGGFARVCDVTLFVPGQ